ncbi:uncharacterized protein DEA37_0003484, partial [Paragonimus westermani]
WLLQKQGEYQRSVIGKSASVVIPFTVLIVKGDAPEGWLCALVISYLLLLCIVIVFSPMCDILWLQVTFCSSDSLLLGIVYRSSSGSPLDDETFLFYTDKFSPTLHYPHLEVMSDLIVSKAAGSHVLQQVPQDSSDSDPSLIVPKKTEYSVNCKMRYRLR